MRFFSIETEASQKAAEVEDDRRLVELAMKREIPEEWLTKAFRVGNVSRQRQERVRRLLSEQVGRAEPCLQG